jgi:hypothetical protein
MPDKRKRRSKAEMEALYAAISDVVLEEHPTTCRSVFYRLVSRGVIEKSEGEYNNAVIRLLTKLRRSREIPFSWITDGTRLRRKPRSYDSLQSALAETRDAYRRALWNDQEAYVEVWSEKDALTGVLYDVTSQWDVPLMVSRGYSSLTYLYSAAAEIAEQDKPAYLYYFGDYDPSGIDISRKVERDLRDFAPDAEIHFQRVAVTEEQIELFNLPTRPTKKSDSRAKNFAGASVEVDAIPPATLRQLARDCITQHIDRYALRQTERIEAAELETFQAIMWGPA